MTVVVHVGMQLWWHHGDACDWS